MMSATADKRKEEGVRERKQGQLMQVMHRMRKNRMAMAGLIIILALIVLAIISPLILPYAYEAMDFANMYATPSAQHWFGCAASCQNTESSTAISPIRTSPAMCG